MVDTPHTQQHIGTGLIKDRSYQRQVRKKRKGKEKNFSLITIRRVIKYLKIYIGVYPKVKNIRVYKGLLQTARGKIDLLTVFN